MAKLAVKLRNEKRRKTVEKFKAKRALILEILQDPRASDEFSAIAAPETGPGDHFTGAALRRDPPAARPIDRPTSLPA